MSRPEPLVMPAVDRRADGFSVPTNKVHLEERNMNGPEIEFDWDHSVLPEGADPVILNAPADLEMEISV